MKPFYITYDGKAWGTTDDAPSVDVEATSLVDSFKTAAGYVPFERPANPSLMDRIAYSLCGGQRFQALPEKVSVSLKRGPTLTQPFSKAELLSIV